MMKITGVEPPDAATGYVKMDNLVKPLGETPDRFRSVVLSLATHFRSAAITDRKPQ
jgi:hypothetical protein